MDVNTADPAGTTLLMIAARNGNHELLEFLLRKRANFSILNRYGDSALSLAALQGHLRIVQFLGEMGAPMNQERWGALHYAAFAGHLEVAAYLLSKGADINARAPNGQTARQLADKASEPWGVKVLRYEIKNITPPGDILAAMEKQMRAEREKRAIILTAEGERDAAINVAEGAKQQVIKASEAKKQQQINEAEGQASAILAVAKATAEGIRSVAQAIGSEGGFEAVQLRVAEQYITQFGHLAMAGNSLVIPSNLSDPATLLAVAMNVIQRGGAGQPKPPVR